MCGIVGIYLKSKKFEKSLGGMLSKMLVSMESRGPDSAGFAIYNSDKNKIYKYSICLNEMSFEKFKKEMKKKVKFTNIEKNSDHVILKSIEKPNKILPILESYDEISLVGYGKSIEIFKQVGSPSNVVKKFNLDNFSGTHAIGHTRMATESAITTNGGEQGGSFEKNMTITLESYIGKVGGKEGVKLEQQYLIGENGLELMSHHPLENI